MSSSLEVSESRSGISDRNRGGITFRFPGDRKKCGQSAGFQLQHEALFKSAVSLHALSADVVLQLLSFPSFRPLFF